MIDADSPLRGLVNVMEGHKQELPIVRWEESWKPSAGHGVVAGLLDTQFDEHLPDLVGADVVTKDFTGHHIGPEMAEHGTHSVATLVGQGHDQICGLAPRARLLVAMVVDSNGIASPDAVVRGIDWLISSHAQIIILPLGEAVERQEIRESIQAATKHGTVCFAAAGNNYPHSILFPARYSFVVAVGAVDSQGDLLPECSRMPRLDLIAPGWQIAAPVRHSVVRQRSGSSVACVMAAGVCMLALSAGVIQATSLSRPQVLAVLRRDSRAREPPNRATT